jgi:acyl dehydratase
MPTIVPVEVLMLMEDEELPPSDWLTIDQERVQRFADATDDHQFIHVDPEKAAESLFGTTVAHGYLTLSLLPHLSAETTVIPERLLMAINYGLNRVRFLQPVKVGSAVRLRSKILKVVAKGPDRVLVTYEATVEIKGEERPALTAETLALYVVGKAPN